jgi:hypothetical protein
MLNFEIPELFCEVSMGDLLNYQPPEEFLFE